MKLVIGLGNFGKEYEKTHHNVGFLVVDKLKEFFDAKKEKNECEAIVSECNCNGEKIMFAKPTTFMNNSGRALRALQNKYNVPAEDTIIIYDDMDIEPGLVRIRNSGSAGTHNGMKSIIAFANGNNFLRFRVGTGRPTNGQTIIDYVLSRIPNDSKIYDGIDHCTEAVKTLLEGETFEIVRTKFSK